MASNDVKCGGYDEVFVDPVGDFLKCIVCHLVLKVPLQVMKCGHRFCETCFNQMKTYSEQFKSPLCCPLDRDEIDTKLVFNDTGIARLIGDLKVRCSSSISSSGCAWSGELRELETHTVDCCYTAKALQSLMNNNMPSEISSVLESYHQRLVACEEKMIEKEKDIAYLKFNLQEMKNKEAEMELKEKRREDQMEKLKLQNLDLSREIKNLKEQPYRFIGDTKEKNSSSNVARLKTDLDEVKVRLESLEENNVFKRRKTKLSVNDVIEGLNKRMLRSGCSVTADVPANVETLEAIFQEIDELRAQSNHINDLWSFSESTSLVKNTVFVWRVNDFREKSHSKKSFYSSKIFCRPKGHICQLIGSIVKENGSILVALRILNERNGADVSTFDCGVKLELVYNDGRRKEGTQTEKISEGHRMFMYRFFCANNNNYDEYVIKDRCTIVCTLIP